MYTALHRLAVLSAGVLGAMALAMPVLAFAQVSPFISFGGRVISINYCTHGAVNVIIWPAGAFPVSYVWSLPPTTRTATLPYVPPTRPGQQVLGYAAPVPVPCVGFGTHPPVWWGLQVLYGGASPLF